MLPKRNVRAPAFPEGLDWLNVPHPLTLGGLRGRFVLLDFWTYGCINCLHILPDLERLEAEHTDVLTVIGVHSAKFDNERSTERLRRAVQRYGVRHPVVNDAGFAVWRQYAVRAWPTCILIDPQGYVVGQTSGEGIYAPFDEALRDLVPRYEAEGLLQRGPLEVSPTSEPPRMLRFPAKVTAHESSGRLFISDTGHHRLLVTDLDGLVRQVVGAGEAGLRDGTLEEAAFRSPQGAAFDAEREVLYVAEPENHALRRVDLRAGRVTTLAGTGAQAPSGVTEATGPEAPLNAPWDVLLNDDVLHDGSLYVAMAGPHQLWCFDPETGRGAVYAGDGREGLIDGPRLEAQLAQPSGLCTDGDVLYFADSEASALRRVPFGDEHVEVETLVGEGLFAFGDVDGRLPRARLQHPLGLACGGDVVYVADTYNHRLKRYFVRDRAVVAFVGTGTAGQADGGPNAAQFDEPGGLALAGGDLYVADTNNHRIAVVERATGRTRTLPVAEPLGRVQGQAEQEHALVTVAPGAGTLMVDVRLPEGYEANAAQRGTLTLRTEDEGVARVPEDEQPVAYPTVVTARFAEGQTRLRVAGKAYACHVASGRCVRYSVHLRVPLVVRPDAGSTARVEVGLSD